MHVRDRIKHRSGEEGVVAVMVLLLGFALMIMAVVVTTRAMNHARVTLLDARWEQALYVAESGLNVGSFTLEDFPTFTTGEAQPGTFLGREDERAWVVATADARPETDLVSTPEGEYVLVKPSNADVLYSVGFVPSRADSSRRVRVLSAEVGEVMVPGPWPMTYGFLSGGDLSISGNPNLTSAEEMGLHSNGELNISGTVTVDGCATAAGGYVNSGDLYQSAGCELPGEQPVVVIPDVGPRQFWNLSEYDLCPSGAVRAGPAHPLFGSTATDEPCSGSVLTADASVPYRGWKFNGCCDSKMGAFWLLDSESPGDGVYYVYHGSVEMSKDVGTPTNPWQATVLVEGEGSCSSIVGGDVLVSGNPSMTAAPGASSLMVSAGRDLEISGNPDMVLAGILAAHEQVKLNGNPVIVEGGFIAQEACNSEEDNIQFTEVSGNFTVDNSGAIESPFSALVGETALTFWDEL